MIRQLQTRLYDFSDTGLDFCAGAKNKIRGVFKKIYVDGYNPQTVSSLDFIDEGVQRKVTLHYPTAHGYVQDRVIELSDANGYKEEFYVFSVTANDVVFYTDQTFTGSFTNPLVTKVASLGWTLVYEVGDVVIYKFKHLRDDSDLFVRYVFTPTGATTGRNCVSICVGKTADLTVGTITDTNSWAGTRSNSAVDDGFKWGFSLNATNTYNDSTYSQGFSTFGKGMVVGSIYHVAWMSNGYYYTYSDGMINAILPYAGYTAIESTINLPVILGDNGSKTNGNIRADAVRYFTLGNIRITAAENKASVGSQLRYAVAQSTAVSSAIDTFNTTMAVPIQFYEYSTYQPLGFLMGTYQIWYDGSTAPSIYANQIPLIQYDTDLNNILATHAMCISSGTTPIYAGYYTFPVEEIKVGY